MKLTRYFRAHRLKTSRHLISIFIVENFFIYFRADSIMCQKVFSCNYYKKNVKYHNNSIIFYKQKYNTEIGEETKHFLQECGSLSLIDTF